MPITKGFRQLVDEASAQITTYSVAQVRERLSDPQVQVVDIRDVRELEREGTVRAASTRHAACWSSGSTRRRPTTSRCSATSSKEYILFCGAGWRSALATKALKDMGMTNVAHIDGGFAEWVKQGAPVETYEAHRAHRTSGEVTAVEPCPCGRRDAAAQAARLCAVLRPLPGRLAARRRPMRARSCARATPPSCGAMTPICWPPGMPARARRRCNLEPGTKWLGLEVRDQRQLDADHAEVEFVARTRPGPAAPCACTSAAASCARPGAGITSTATRVNRMLLFCMTCALLVPELSHDNSKFDAVLFDCDGVLVDSESDHQRRAARHAGGARLEARAQTSACAIFLGKAVKDERGADRGATPASR